MINQVLGLIAKPEKLAEIVDSLLQKAIDATETKLVLLRRDPVTGKTIILEIQSIPDGNDNPRMEARRKHELIDIVTAATQKKEE